MASVALGTIVAAHGVRGAVRVHSDTTPPQQIAAYPLFFTPDMLDSPHKARCLAVTAKGVLLQFHGIGSRDEAEALRGKTLWTARNNLPPLNAEEFYQADWLGRPVCDETGATLGAITAFHHYGAGEIVEITSAAETKRSVMIPLGALQETAGTLTLARETWAVFS